MSTVVSCGHFLNKHLKAYMLNISTEVINYQNSDSFPDKLQSIVFDIYNEIDSNTYKNNKALIEKSKNIDRISKLIKDRFNMSVKVDNVLHGIAPAAIIPFFADYMKEVNIIRNIGVDSVIKLFSFTNGVLNRVKEIEENKLNILNKIHNKKGYVDVKNARVGGYLAEIQHFLILDFFTLKKSGITVNEMVAIIAHEIGHAFHGLEAHHKLEKTNSSIIDVLTNINDNQLDKAVYVFKKNFTEEEFKNASVSSKEEIHDFYGKIALAYLGEIKSQIGNSKYDETNFENLADIFVSKFNLNSDLVSALHKLHLLIDPCIEGSGKLIATMYLIDLFSMLCFLLIFGKIGVSIYAFIILFLLGNRNQLMTYDNPKERYTRIKNSLINNIKNIDLPDEVLKDLLDQYNFIVEIIERTNYFKDILSIIADTIVPENIENTYYIKLQQSIENNLNNILFVKAAQVKLS